MTALISYSSWANDWWMLSVMNKTSLSVLFYALARSGTCTCPVVGLKIAGACYKAVLFV